MSNIKRKDWEKNLNSFIKDYRDKFRSCFMVGSLVYQNKFSKNSDIDLVIVLNNLREWDYACKTFLKDAAEFISETKRLYKKNKAQYFCLKFKYRDILYSVDFVPKDFFANAIQDLNKKKSTMYYKITNEPQTNSYEFGCRSKRISIKKINVFHKKSVSVSSPLYTIKDNNFYFGIMIDKLITGYLYLWSSDGDEDRINELCLNAMLKWILINKGNKMKDIIGSLNRIKTLPQKHVRKQILFYESGLKSYL